MRHKTQRGRCALLLQSKFLIKHKDNLDQITFKCPFQHKPFYDNVIQKSPKIGTQNKFSVTLYIFLKRAIVFHSLNLLEINRKYRGQFHSRKKPGPTYYLLPSAFQKVLGFRTESLKADDKSAPVILSASCSLASM